MLSLPETIDDVRVARRAPERGVVVRPLSRYYSGRQRPRSGLLLGFACVKESDMGAPFERLLSCLQREAAGGRASSR